MSPGTLLREARQRHGISQKRLAARAGTTQSAISRIERDRVSPSVETLRELLVLLGQDLELNASGRDTGIDTSLNRENLQLSISRRLQRGLQFADTVRRGRGGDSPSPATLRHMAKTDLGEGLDLHPLLAALVRHQVDFVVIGGVAGWIHGSSYPTYDLDVAYARDRANLARLAAALVELEVRWRGGPPDLPIEVDAAMLDKGANFTFNTDFGMFDVLGDLEGVSNYETILRAARLEVYKGLEIRVAALDHLIAMKRKASRIKDKLMVIEYIEISELEDPDPEWDHLDERDYDR